MVYEKGYRLVSVIVLGTMVISSIVVVEGLEPFVKQRSNIDVVPVVDSYDGISITTTGTVHPLYTIQVIRLLKSTVMKVAGMIEIKLKTQCRVVKEISYGTS